MLVSWKQVAEIAPTFAQLSPKLSLWISIVRSGVDVRLYDRWLNADTQSHSVPVRSFLVILWGRRCVIL